MTGRKGRRVMAGLLCGLLIPGFSGCREKPEDVQVIDGGTTTHRDPDAPTVIESTELTEFYASFWLDTRYRGNEIRFFSFSVEPDGNGTPTARLSARLIAREKGSGISRQADGELLAALAEIVEKYGLAEQNGLYDVTAGLPEEFQAQPFLAVYASGEELSFTVNNDPLSAWAEEVYDTFAAWFASQGIDALEPALDESPMTRFSLEFTENGTMVWYTGITVDEATAIDGEDFLLGKLVNGELHGDEERYILFPEDYYEKVGAIVRASDLMKSYEFSFFDRQSGDWGNHDLGYYGMGPGTSADNEPDAEDLAVDLYMEFESGYRMNVDTRKASEIEGMRPLLDALIEYHESLFR